jgi:pimeloyl-ACP methyl ester carboxylesterase
MSSIRGGTLHRYLRGRIAFEHPTSAGNPHKNLLVFVGGLTDGIQTVPYVERLAKSLDTKGWGVAELLISSSYKGWGTGSLTRDAGEIAAAVKYFRSAAGGARGKIVLQGHSTGCQDSVYYVTQEYGGDKFPLADRPKLDGVVLQAGASDGEAYVLLNGQETYDKNLKLAREWVATGHGQDVLPAAVCSSFFNTPISAQRWVDIMEKKGPEDFFSTDLTVDDMSKTFGRINVPLLVCFSGNDEFVPKEADKAALVERFRQATAENIWSRHSGIVKGATHNVNEKSEPGAVEDLIGRISKFLEDVE